MEDDSRHVCVGEVRIFIMGPRFRLDKDVVCQLEPRPNQEFGSANGGETLLLILLSSVRVNFGSSLWTYGLDS